MMTSTAESGGDDDSSKAIHFPICFWSLVREMERCKRGRQSKRLREHCHIFGKRRWPDTPLAGERMRQFKPHRMSGLERKGCGAMPRPCVAIYWVANQRMAKMREVHANLMRASGFQIALHGADGWARFVRHCEHPVMGARGLACRAGNNGMLNTVARMVSKRGIDGAFLPRKRPKRKGQITALHSARLKLTDQMRIGGQRSRNDHYA